MKNTRFWFDSCLYEKPLYLMVPVLFELCDNKEITVAQARSGEPVTFRRWLFREVRVSWDLIWTDVMKFQLFSDPDIIGLETWKN